MDWSIDGTLAKLEEYNGLGYAMRGRPSPYIRSGTDQYRSGKYVRDGVFDPDSVDGQLGCAGLLSWSKIRVWINGVSAEAADLRQKAAQLEAKPRSL